MSGIMIIEDYHVVRIFLDFAQRLSTAMRGLDLVVAAAENAQIALDDDLLVVDDKNSCTH